MVLGFATCKSADRPNAKKIVYSYRLVGNFRHLPLFLEMNIICNQFEFIFLKKKIIFNIILKVTLILIIFVVIYTRYELTGYEAELCKYHTLTVDSRESHHKFFFFF